MMGKRYNLKLSELIDVRADTCEEFYNSTHDKLKDMLERALKSLRSKAVIHWQKVMTVCVKSRKVIYDNEGEPVFSKDGIKYIEKMEYRKATKLERRSIIETEDKVLKDMKLDSIQDVVIRGLWKKYINKVNKIISGKYNIEFYYDSYDVVYNYEQIIKTHIKIEEDFLLKSDERVQIRDDLNLKLQCRLVDSAEKKNLKSNDKIAPWVEYCEEIQRTGGRIDQTDYIYVAPAKAYFTRHKGTYVEESEKLIETVIKPCAKDLRNELRKSLVKRRKY